MAFGTKSILHPTKKMWAWPSKIEFHFLPAIETAHLDTSQTDALKVSTFQLMKTYFIEHKRA